MKNKEKDLCYEFYRLSSRQQDFFVDLVQYLDVILRCNVKVFNLVTGPLFDCLHAPGTRCIMEAIEECALLDPLDTGWTNLKIRAKEVGILSRSDLKLIRMGIMSTSDSDTDDSNKISFIRSVNNYSKPYIIPKPSTPKGIALKFQKTISYHSIIKALRQLGCTPTGVIKGSHETWQRDIYVFYVVKPHRGQKKMCSQYALRLILLGSHLSYDDIAANM